MIGIVLKRNTDPEQQSSAHANRVVKNAAVTAAHKPHHNPLQKYAGRVPTYELRMLLSKVCRQ